MQTICMLEPRYYQIRKACVSTDNQKEALHRWKILKRFERAMERGLSSRDAAFVVGVSRATLYRWKKRKSKKLDDLIPYSRRPKNPRKPTDKRALRIRIQELREEFPSWGKRKITCLLLRENMTAKESTVGRIISNLIKRRVIQSAKLTLQQACKRARPKRPYVIYLKRGQRLYGQKPGDVLQIDHMTVPISGRTFKHFNAVCTTSRWNFANVFSRATAQTASEFIDGIVHTTPFDIRCIQVDGGSEFMADFEEACHRHQIQISVLAPKSPKLNGHVERINGTWRSDFYHLYDLPDCLAELRPLLENYNDTYNWDRPHESLALQTPQEFLERCGVQVDL